MQQRQPRLGDILDDYCPRERRLTNHAVVAMIGDDIRLTRCTTCEAEHDYKQARLPRLRKKTDGVPSVIGAPLPKRIVADLQTVLAIPPAIQPGDGREALRSAALTSGAQSIAAAPTVVGDEAEATDSQFAAFPPARVEEGPVHRQLIRAQLPRIDGQPPAPRQAPDFTIRQPSGRPYNRFRGRPGDGGSGGPGQNGRRGASGGRPPALPRAAHRQDSGRKRSK